MPRQLPLTTLATLVTFGYSAYYLTVCWIFPFTDCRRCGGDGKRRSPSGRTYRLCRRCHATGRRLRTGRKVWNWLRNLHHDSKTGGDLW
jgi:hypothetical protein